MASAAFDFVPTRPVHDAPAASDRAGAAGFCGTEVLAALLLLAVAGHHWVLCLVHTQGMGVSVARVAMLELLIYAACVPWLLKRVSLRALIAVFTALGALGVLALLRGGYFDPKAARDMLIPLLFLWAGRSYAQSPRSLDRPLLIVAGVIAAIGLAQAAAPEAYNRFFNTFSYYVSLGVIDSESAQVVGQSVTLNGLRPEGIGRTLLPQLLGAQRIPSVFLEPVSLGNFAVILLAYGLAKPMRAWRAMLPFVVASALLIVLADSRFGLYMSALLVLLRVLVHGRVHVVAIVFPLVGACVLLWLAAYAPAAGDNLLGRMTVSGQYLMRFNEWSVLGLQGFATNYGDMGYAYVISRFGVAGAALMWICLFLLPLKDEAALRFRTFVSAYVTLILCVSGTSLFALKTAGVLWFLVGVLSLQGHAPRAAPLAAKGDTR